MSFLTLAFPAEAALPLAQAMMAAIVAMLRPLLGVGALAAFLMVFKPLVLGILRAALVLLVPRKSLEQRVCDHRFSGIRLLNRMANDYAGSQPNFAAELRNLARRDQ